MLNSVTSTISVFDGKTNTLTGTITIPTPAGGIVSQPVPPGTLLSEIKPGNTFYSTSTSTMTTLGGAIAIAVNESSNLLYVASVNGTISVFALNPPAAPAAFSVNGVIKNAQGEPGRSRRRKTGFDLHRTNWPSVKTPRAETNARIRPSLYLLAPASV